MSQQISKSALSTVFAISFVWFTTQYGGGFATGAQLRQFFIDYGMWCVAISVGAQALSAVINGYMVYFARKHKTGNYKLYNDKFYGSYSKIFSPAYELVFGFTCLLVTAVAFATGAASLIQILPIPFWVGTGIVGICLFVIVLYGVSVVRATAKFVSYAIIVGLLLVFIPNIFAQGHYISANWSYLTATPAPLGPALWSMLMYVSFQAAASPAIFSQHAQALPSASDAKKFVLWGFVVNASMIGLATYGLLAVIHTEDYLAGTATPVFTLIRTGPGGEMLLPMLSILITLGAISTAVNMVSASVARFGPLLIKDFSQEGGKPSSKTIALIGVLCLIGFSVAQFGLLPLVARGYGTLAYLTLPVIIIPVFVHMIATKFDSHQPGAE